MKSGRARRNRACVMSGIVATAVVVVVGSGPAPGQIEPLGPEITYIDAYGPAVYGYEDCTDVVHTEEETSGYVYVELDDEAETDVSVGISFSGSLADDLVDPPATVDVAAGTDWSEVLFELDELEAGDLTVTAEPGLGYVADGDDTYTLEVSDAVEVVASCKDDLGTPPGHTDRQIIDVGERPVPIGFFDEEEIVEPDPPSETTTTFGPSTTEEPATTETPTTEEPTTEAPTTEGPTTTEADQQSDGFTDLQAQRAAPQGYDTPVANGTIPPGLTYVDDEWTGAATTAGLYSFDIRVCFDQRSFVVAEGRRDGARRPTPRAFPDEICLGYVDVQIAVLGDDTAPAAQPVSAPAQFAG